MTASEELATVFDELDERIGEMEQAITTEGAEASDLKATLDQGAAIVGELLTAYGREHQRDMPASGDLLELFKAFAKGDPSLNAVRDNVRELVFYQNCLAIDREDALPKAPERMVVRTARHIYLYLRTRLEQEGRLG